MEKNHGDGLLMVIEAFDEGIDDSTVRGDTGQAKASVVPSIIQSEHALPPFSRRADPKGMCSSIMPK